MPDPPPVPTILVVDDETAIRDVVRRILLNEGYRVIEAGDGVEALSVAHGERKPIDLLLTDLKMPRMDGRQLADTLREHQPDLKVLFLTAFADSLFADRTMLEDNTAYVEKPVSARGLYEAVRLLLYGSLVGLRESQVHPPLEDLPIATTENEFLRIPLADGGTARLLFTGADPSSAAIQEVISVLKRRLDAMPDGR